MKKLPDWIVLSSALVEMPDGSWFAAMRVKLPNQGGYDRAPHDDVCRVHATREKAVAWLVAKLAGLTLDSTYTHEGPSLTPE